MFVVSIVSRRLDLMEETEGGIQQQEQAVQVRNQVAKSLVILGLVYFVTQTPIRIEDINEDSMKYLLRRVHFVRIPKS